MIHEFTEEQKRYLEGFAAGSALSRSLPVLPDAAPTFSATLGIPAEPRRRGEEQGLHGDTQREAQDRILASGRKLPPEEQAVAEFNIALLVRWIRELVGMLAPPVERAGPGPQVQGAPPPMPGPGPMPGAPPVGGPPMPPGPPGPPMMPAPPGAPPIAA